MDPGWDHTENEDKHLMSQVIGLSTVNDTQVAITSPNTTGSMANTGGGGCTSGSQELVSLSCEYINQMLAVVLNNANKHNIKYYVDNTIFSDLYLYLYKSILQSHFSQYYSIVSKLISNITESLSCYINILSYILSHLKTVVCYITTISTIFHCVHSEIRKLSDCLECYVKQVKSAFKCYITKLEISLQCTLTGNTAEFIQNLQVSVQTCTKEFEKSICEEITKLNSIWFNPTLLFSIRDNLNKIIKLMTSNKNRLSPFKSSINIYNIENLMSYINLNCEMIDIVRSEMPSLIVYVHEYGLYFNSICCHVSCLKSKFCESVVKLQTYTDVQVVQLTRNLQCDLTSFEIDITCEIPDFSNITKQIDSLNCIIQCHENDLHIYDCEIELCLSCINCDFGCLKVYSDYIQDQILRNGYMNKVFFKCSLESNMKLLRKINSNIIGIKNDTNGINGNFSNHNISTNNTSLVQINNVVINMSRIVIDESIFVLSRVYIHNKLKSEISKVLSMLEHCVCIKVFEQYYINSVCSYHRDLAEFPVTDFINWHTIQNDVHNKENVSCLCMIIRYRLIPEVYLIIRYSGYVHFDMLSTISRRFKKYLLPKYDKLLIFKLVYLVIQLIHKITLWTIYKYSDDVRKRYCFCNRYDKNFIYLKLMIIKICELMENIWTMDTESISMAIQKISSLLSEYQSIHVYTNYYSTSIYSMLRNITGLSSGKSIESTLSHSALLTVDESKSPLMFKSRLSLSATLSKKDDKKTIFGTLSTQRIGLFKDSLKIGFMSFKSMILGTHFSKQSFGLIYGKFSSLAFYTQKFRMINTGTIKNITKLGMEISLNYLDKICEKPCEQKCCQKIGICKICPIAKIRINCLSISFKDMGLIIGNVSGDMLLNYIKMSNSRSRDFITNLCVGFGEVYTIMLKNSNLVHRDTHLNPDYSYKGVKDPSSSNWGYDTGYEHEIATLSNHNIMP